MILTIASLLRMVFSLCISRTSLSSDFHKNICLSCLVSRLYGAGFCIATANFRPVKKCLHLEGFDLGKALFYRLCNSVIVLPSPWILGGHTAPEPLCSRQGGPCRRSRTAKQKRRYSAVPLPWLCM